MKKLLLGLVLVLLMNCTVVNACDVCPTPTVGRASYVTSQGNWWTGIALTNYNNFEVTVNISVAHVGTLTYTLEAYTVKTISINTEDLATYLIITSSGNIEAIVILSDNEVALSYPINFEMSE